MEDTPPAPPPSSAPENIPSEVSPLQPHFHSGLKGCFGFLSETKNRLFQAFVRPVAPIPHSPSITQSHDGDRAHQSLNHPFLSVSPPTSSTGCDDSQATSFPIGDDDDKAEQLQRELKEMQSMDMLEEEIIALELAMQGVLITSQADFDAASTEIHLYVDEPPNPAVRNDEQGDSSIRTKLPASVYTEIITMYEGQGSGGQSNLSPDLKQASSKNKERNLRKEVLKWDKD